MRLAIVSYLGSVFSAEGDHAKARLYLEEALNLVEQQKPHNTVYAVVLVWLADVLRLQGETARAATLHEQSVAILRESASTNHLAYALRHWAWVLLQQGSVDAAAARCRESLILNQQSHSEFGILACVSCMAAVRAASGDSERATELLSAVDRMLHKLELRQRPLDQLEYERTVAALQAQLPPERFLAAWQRGQSLEREDAVALALGDDLPA